MGKWWDAVSAPIVVADRALELLDDRSGAVIQDDAHGKAYWLIEVESAKSWSVYQVRVLAALLDEITLLGVPRSRGGPATTTTIRTGECPTGLTAT